MWRIAADTGGTFTDCHALDPQGRESRCKVLSTGHLRAVAASGTEAVFKLSGLPPLPAGLLKGFQINAVGTADIRTITAMTVPRARSRSMRRQHGNPAPCWS